FKQPPLAESPTLGNKVVLSVEYSPKKYGSDFEKLTTLMTGKSFLEIADGHYLAADGALGLQWFDPVYLRTFQLGGSFGESTFIAINKTFYPLRGLDTGQLKGEGLAMAALEYRASLFRRMPGFGTDP